MTGFRFRMVDVFHDGSFTGNPLAVVTLPDPLPDAEMQRIANWLNQSETTFLLPPADPAADYRVRIFTTSRELPFAGHPTLGTCHAWMEAGGVPRTPGQPVQECGVGLVRVRVEDERLAFAAPPLLRAGPVDAETLAEAAAVLGLEPGAIVAAEWLDNGPGWMGLMLRSAEDVLAVEPRRPPGALKLGLVGAHPPGGAAAWEIRTLFSGPGGSVVEDPVTGSFNAGVAQWLRATGRADGGYVAAQGTRLGRRGRVYAAYDADGQAWIGGRVWTMFAGPVAVVA